MKGSIEAAKLQAGMPGTFFQLDYNTLHTLITDCWIKSVWHETMKLDIQLLKRTPTLKPKQEGKIFYFTALLTKATKAVSLKD